MVVMSAVECPWTKRAMNSKYARIAGHVSGWLAVGSLAHAGRQPPTPNGTLLSGCSIPGRIG